MDVATIGNNEPSRCYHACCQLSSNEADLSFPSEHK
jgi:hypothetical protein